MESPSQRLQAWFDEENKRGLVDFKVTLSDNLDGATVDSVASEILLAIASTTVPDMEIF